VEQTCAAGDVCCVHITSGSPMWDVVIQDTRVLARIFATAINGWLVGCMKVYTYMNVCICSPFIVLDVPPRSHLHQQFLFYPVSIHRCGNVC
jgi:hypothetical protein